MRLLILLCACGALLAGTAQGAIELRKYAIVTGKGFAHSTNHVLVYTMGDAVVGESMGGTIRLVGGFRSPERDALVSVPRHDDAPARLGLLTIAPNPLRGSSEISFRLTKPMRVTLAIYDLGGRRLHTLVEGWLPAGPHHHIWNPAQAGFVSGVYYCRLTGEDFEQARKLVWIR